MDIIGYHLKRVQGSKRVQKGFIEPTRKGSLIRVHTHPIYKGVNLMNLEPK